MKRAKREIPLCTLPPLEVGVAVVILRPHLWGGCAGTVVSYDPLSRLHLVRITGKNGDAFHTEAMASDLHQDFAAMLGV